eukprot:SAG31_NODE_29041_length_401_cov_1.986755_1_plen_27_part_10
MRARVRDRIRRADVQRTWSTLVRYIP